jgi:hypothetical protein
MAAAAARLLLAAALLLAACTPGAARVRAVRARDARLAVVMPFTSDNVHKIQRNFGFWKASSPCHLLRKAAFHVHVTFVFQNNRVIDAPQERRLAELWAATEHACFDDVLYLSANQTAAQEQGQTIGGCHQHYNSFTTLHALGFDHWLQFEPDVIPVRADWLTRLAEEVHYNRGCGRWWIEGTPPSYEAHRVTNGARVDGIVFNGNALYCLNEEVLAFVADIQAQFPPVGCHVPPEHARDGLLGLVGFDWCVRVELAPWKRAPQVASQRALTGRSSAHACGRVNYLYRTSVRNREKFKAKAFLFRAVDWLADYGCCVNERDVAAAVAKNPNLMLVHTKVYF